MAVVWGLLCDSMLAGPILTAGPPGDRADLGSHLRCSYREVG